MCLGAVVERLAIVNRLIVRAEAQAAISIYWQGAVAYNFGISISSCSIFRKGGIPLLVCGDSFRIFPSKGFPFCPGREHNLYCSGVATIDSRFVLQSQRDWIDGIVLQGCEVKADGELRHILAVGKRHTRGNGEQASLVGRLDIHSESAFGLHTSHLHIHTVLSFVDIELGSHIRREIDLCVVGLAHHLIVVRRAGGQTDDSKQCRQRHCYGFVCFHLA